MSARSFRREQQKRVAAARRRQELRARRMAIGVAAAGAFALTAPAAASAANFEVNDLGDAGDGTCDATCTLRDAVDDADAAMSDDTITFLSGLTGTIHLGSQITISDNYELDIQGPGRNVITVSGDNAVRVLYVDNSNYVSISSLTLTYGDTGTSGGAVYIDTTPVDLTDVEVSDSDAVDDGGGIAAVNSSGPYSPPLTITDSTISGNTSHATGGPPYAGGGGIFTQTSLTVDGSTITGNHADDANGGGIGQGGTGGPSVGSGMDISDSVISGNYAYFAGGVSAFNFAYVGSSRNSIVDSTISGNQAISAGGGIGFKYVGGSSRWTVSHTTLSGNHADGYGGGMAVGVVDGSLELVDSTISGNDAAFGGGVDLSPAAQKYDDSVLLNNSTIASNNALAAGGGIYIEDYCGCTPSADDVPGATQLNSTVVGDNTAAGSPQDAEQGTSPAGAGLDLSFSLLENPGNTTITQTPAGSNIFGVDPQLGPLADNGGPTLTHLPAITSPVVDKGTAPARLTTDQRGAPRTVNTSVPNAADGTDIGAVELGVGPPVPPGPAPTITITAFPNKPGGQKKKGKIKTKKKRVMVEMWFAADVPGSTFTCSVDGGPAQPCTSPFSTRVSSKPGKGKRHTITVVAKDPAGNLGPPVTAEFRVIRTV